MFDRLIWRDDRMLLDDLVFRLEPAKRDGWELGEECFRFYKTRSLIEQYESYWLATKAFEANRILELGIWDGGSAAFWYECFHPDKYVAIDISEKKDSPYFQRYRVSRGLESAIQTIWGVDQGDSETLPRIIQTEFSGDVDLVIDDASHIYKPTKASFETLFPFLRPGGIYVIEDWGWEFWEECHAPNYPLAAERGLTELLFELIGATASSTELISSLSVYQGFVAIERGPIRLSYDDPFHTERYITQRPRLSRVRAKASRRFRRELGRTRSIVRRVSRAANTVFGWLAA